MMKSLSMGLQTMKDRSRTSPKQLRLITLSSRWMRRSSTTSPNGLCSSNSSRSPHTRLYDLYTIYPKVKIIKSKEALSTPLKFLGI